MVNQIVEVYEDEFIDAITDRGFSWCDLCFGCAPYKDGIALYEE